MIYLPVRHLPTPNDELVQRPIESLYDSIAMSLRGYKAGPDETYDSNGLTVSPGVRKELHDRAIKAGTDKGDFAILWLLKAPAVDEGLHGLCAAIGDDGFIRPKNEKKSRII